MHGLDPTDMYRRWMIEAYKLATKSPDPSNQNGAMLIWHGRPIAESWNDFPPHVEKPALKWADRDEKLKHVSHAEEGCIQKAAAYGVQAMGTLMVCPWAACMGCARDLIMAKIAVLVVHDRRMETTPLRWKDEVDYALDWMRRNGIKIHYFEGLIPEAPKIRVNGEMWQP